MPEGAHEGYEPKQEVEPFHQEARELLGDKYDEKKLDAIAAVSGWSEILDELEMLPEEAEARAAAIADWYKQHAETTNWLVGDSEKEAV